MKFTSRRGSREVAVIRRAVMIAFTVAVAAPCWAANKDIERLQLQIVNLQGQVVDLQRGLEESLKEIRRLNETLAQQNGSIKKAIEDQRTQGEAIQAGLKDVMDRMGELRERFPAAPPAGPAPAGGASEGGAPAGGGAPTGAPGPAQGAGAQPPAPRELYSQAYADYARGNYDLAIQAFQEYLKNYPQTDFSDNAQYWIGECHYGKQRYTEAVEAWNTLLRDFPSSDKLPDARVKKGMALERLGRRSQALVEYRYVLDRYPNSPAARLAKERLNP
jgi:tol-pal system protein YbgF